jgi:hypothetical protein
MTKENDVGLMVEFLSVDWEDVDQEVCDTNEAHA